MHTQARTTSVQAQAASTSCIHKRTIFAIRLGNPRSHDVRVGAPIYRHMFHVIPIQAQPGLQECIHSCRRACIRHKQHGRSGTQPASHLSCYHGVLCDTTAPVAVSMNSLNYSPVSMVDLPTAYATPCIATASLACQTVMVLRSSHMTQHLCLL